MSSDLIAEEPPVQHRTRNDLRITVFLFVSLGGNDPRRSRRLRD